MIAGMLSGPKDLADLTDCKTPFNSTMKNSFVGMSNGSDIFTLGSEKLVGSFGFLSSSFFKCSVQLDSLFSVEPPFSLMDGFERLPEISEIVDHTA